MTYKEEYEQAKQDGTLQHVSGIGILIDKLDEMIKMQDKGNLRLYQIVKDIEQIKQDVEKISRK